MRKLEPMLPFPRKPVRFKSPYKSPGILKKTPKENENQEPKSTTFRNRELDNSVQNPVIINEPAQTAMKLGEGTSSDVPGRNKKVIATKVLTSLPNMSPVKIQPIDPYMFCETILKDCARSTVPEKDTVFKRSKEEQVCF